MNRKATIPAIVMVSFGRPALLWKTLDSLKENTEKDSYRLIVVDNGSLNEQRVKLAQRTEIDELVLLGRNAGKPYSWNLGFLMSYNLCIADNDEKPDYFVFCDSDLEFSKEWLPTMMEVYKKYEHLPLGVLSGYLNTVGEFKVDRVNSTEELEIRRHPPGCCLMVSRKVIEAVGLFDSKIKIRGVDTAYTARLWRAGYKNACIRNRGELVKHTGEKQRTWELISGKPIYKKD